MPINNDYRKISNKSEYHIESSSRDAAIRDARIKIRKLKTEIEYLKQFKKDYNNEIKGINAAKELYDTIYIAIARASNVYCTDENLDPINNGYSILENYAEALEEISGDIQREEKRLDELYAQAKIELNAAESMPYPGVSITEGAP